MKNGLVWENGTLFFYKDDQPHHAGIVKDGDKLYYIGRGGQAVTGRHVVHRSMTNGLVPHGTYTFGEDFALVEGSYLAPVKKVRKSKKRRHASRKNTKAERIKRKKMRILLGGIGGAFALLLVIGTAAIVANLMGGNTPPASSSVEGSEDGGLDKVKLPSFNGEVLLCTEQARNQYEGRTDITEARKGGNPYQAFVFSYELGRDGTLAISERADMTAATTFVLSAHETSLTIDNLKVATTYYYCVTVADKTYSGSFRTAKTTRFVSLPDVPNTRDIGGYETADGRVIKQGMIIRGAELDGLEEPTYFLRSDKVEQVTATFGFVCDLDLRNGVMFPENYQSRLGADVEHRFYHAPAYGEIFNENSRETMRAIFSTFADSANYPMYLHCTYGADRTGTTVYLLQGLLGVSEEDMEAEYRLTGYMIGDYATSTRMDVIRNGLAAFEGDTLQEQIENYLVNFVGVTPEEIASIRANLLEDAAS
ncbi:MAG: tyrosine-protein phosphatase [Clostridia bacterium]|nr:tyrosine-protein phosphatase [Clostridia bacterium]